MDAVAADLKYALRQARRHPVFTLAAIASLALGIGANTATFSVLNAVLLRPLAAPAASEVFALRREARVAAARRFSYRSFEELRDAATPAAAAAMSQSQRVSVAIGSGNPPERANLQLVSGGFFQLLSVPSALGRLIEPDDDRNVGAHPVAVISHRYWSERFGSARDVLGRTLTLNGSAFSVVGVASPGFAGVFLETPTDIWIPTMMQSDIHYHQNFSSTVGDPERPWVPQDDITWLDVLVRADRDALPRLAASLNASFRNRLLRHADSIGDPERRKQTLETRIVLDSFSNGRSWLRDRYTALLYALMAMVVIVLSIACANTANLLLARSAARQREIAVRLSLGAARGRLIRQLLTESFLLAGAAAVAGVLMARWSADALLGIVLGGFSGSSSAIVELDARVLAFTAAISVVTALMFGLVPAYRSTRPDLTTAMKAGYGGARDSAGWSPAKLVIVAQVALSMVLVTGSVLFVRSLTNLARIPLGFDRDRVLNVAVDPRNSGVGPTDLSALYARVCEQVESLPGVRSSAFAECGIVGGCRSASDGISISGYAASPSEQVLFQENRVGAAYLQTAGLTLIRGRNFDARDTVTAPKVAIVNQALVRRYFAGREPLGQRFGYQTPDTEIVGVVADARVYSAREAAEPMAYYPLEQAMLYAPSLAVRTSGDPAAIVPAVREAIRSAAPTLAVDRMTTVAQQLATSLNADRIAALLAAAFGGLALALAGVGLYGLMSYAVARRTAEIGVRIALGARPGRVLRAILMETLGLIGTGVLIGLPLAAAGGRAVSSVLFGVAPWDAGPVAAAALALAVLGIGAALAPAWRASRVDPIIALRAD
jgi:predicted permease